MKSFILAISLLSAQAFAGGFPINIGNIGEVVGDLQQLDQMANQDKPHVCRISDSFAGYFEATGNTLRDAKFNTLSACKAQSSDPFFCREPSNAACERLKGVAAPTQPQQPTVVVQQPPVVIQPPPAAAKSCVRKGQVCEGDFFQCEYDSGNVQEIYIIKAYEGQKGEYAITNSRFLRADGGPSVMRYDELMSAKSIDFNSCQKTASDLTDSPL